MSDDGIGYHTPDVEKFSGNVESRILTLPLSLWYLVNGALEELTFEQNWFEFGSATPEETAAFFLEALDELRPYPMIGAVIPLAIDPFPDFVLPCDGSAFLREDYPDLYAVLDPALIVDADNFRTPDIVGRFLLADGNGRSLTDMGGEETHTLTIPELPSHSHEYTPPVANIDIEAPGAPDVLAAGMGTPTQTGNTGNGDAHNNMPPFYVVKYGIVAK